ncbi:MAG: ATP-binding protein [Spirochaetales bacterium]|nr:ATP-binding protein [Spirochaetales bacterium]
MIKRKVLVLDEIKGTFSQELHTSFQSLGRKSLHIEIDKEGEGPLDYLVIGASLRIGEEHHRLYERMNDLTGVVIVASNHLGGLRGLLFCKEERIAVLGLVGEKELAVKLNLPYLGRVDEVAKIGAYLDARMDFYG